VVGRGRRRVGRYVEWGDRGDEEGKEREGKRLEERRTRRGWRGGEERRSGFGSVVWGSLRGRGRGYRRRRKSALVERPRRRESD